MKPKSNTLNLTIKFVSLEALINLADKLPIHIKNVGNQNNSPLYLPYILSQGIMDCVKTIKTDLQERKTIKYTKALSLGIGLITSALVSCSYNGVEYVLNFSLTLLKTTATTLIIDKLNQLKSIDGVSVTILMNLIFSIPTIIVGLSSQPLASSLLFIGSLGIMAYGNYKLLQYSEDVKMHYKDKIDKFSISTRNTFTTSLMISSFISTLVTNNSIIQSSILFIINPLIQWFLSKSYTDKDELNKYIQNNGIYLNGHKHGKETKSTINKMVRDNSIKLGVIGVVTYGLCSLLIGVFGIAISPIMLSVAVNSFINVSFSVKTLVKSNKLDKLFSNNIKGRNEKCYIKN